MRLTSFVALLLLLFSSLQASENGLDVCFIQSITNAVPGQAITIQTKITNKSSTHQILVGHLELPPLWQAVPCNDMLMHIDAGQTSIQNVVIEIPSTASPGEFPVRYDVWARDNSSIMDRDKAAVVIGRITNNEIPIELEITSPPLVDANPEDILFVTGLLTNTGECFYEGNICIAAPEGWQSMPAEKVGFSLAPTESKVLIYGVKVPKLALAGEHAISLRLEEDPSFQRSMTALIKPKIDVCSVIEGHEGFHNLNQAVQIYVNYMNKGNLPLTVQIETSAEPYCDLVYISDPFEIPPMESCEVPITVRTEAYTDEHDQFVLIKLIDVNTGEQLYQNPLTLKFVSNKKAEDDPYAYIPAHLSLMALGDRYKRIVAAEYAGGGLIDPETNRYFEFFLRVPTEVEHVIYNIDQRLYAGIYDDEWDIRLGDTIYELSPLTQRFRYGRGGSIAQELDRWSWGVHYTQNTLNGEYNPKETCAYLEYSLSDCWTVSTNFLHKVEKEIPTSNLLTLQTDFEFPPNFDTEMEVGINVLDHGCQRNNYAYRIATNGQFANDGWFNFEKVYAGPDFYGYYNHQHLLSTSIDFPVTDNLRFNGNINRSKQNFLPLEEEEGAIIPRQHQYACNLIYTFGQNFSCSINTLWLRGQDMGLFPQYDFYQKWYGPSLYFASNGYHCNANISFGQQKDYLTHTSTDFLQRYYFYVSKSFSANLMGSAFYDGGNINYYDARPWRSSYGGSLVYRFAPMGVFELCLQKVQQTQDMLDLSQITANFNYTFKNLHKLQVMAQHYHYKTHYPNDTIFLASYTIPFSMPVCRRNDIGDLSGTVFDTNNHRGVAGATISCDQFRTTTDRDGRFYFKCLPKNSYTPRLEFLPDDLIALNKDDRPVDIPGGGEGCYAIPVVESCCIKGSLVHYEFTDLFALMTDPAKCEQRQVGGLEGVTIAISLNDDQEIYSTTTNIKGEFCFPKLRPGHWQIRIHSELLPPLHDLNFNDLIVEMSPKEERNIDFKLMPQAPKLFKLE